MTKTNYKDINQLILIAVSLKHSFQKQGLYKTAQKMDEVVEEVGWEAAEILEGKHPTKLKSRKHEKKNKTLETLQILP